MTTPGSPDLPDGRFPDPDLSDRPVLDPDASDASATAVSPVATPLPRRHRMLFWGCVVVSLAMIGGGGYLAVTAYQEETAPERVVLDYLTALADGDAAAALAYGDVPAGDTDLLSDEVLGAQLAIAPMSGFDVDVVDVGPDAATAEISYELAFDDGVQVVEDELQLVRTGRIWRLAEVAEPVVIRVTNGASRVSLAGAAVPDGPHLMFPGALPVALDTPNLEFADDVRVVRFAAEGDLEEQVELSEAGAAAVAGAIEDAIGACLAGTATAPTLCPLPAEERAVPGSLRGELTGPAAPELRIETQAGNDGLVRIQGELTVTGEFQELDFNNQRITRTGDVVIAVHAIAYASEPGTIIWRTA